MTKFLIKKNQKKEYIYNSNLNIKNQQIKHTSIILKISIFNIICNLSLFIIKYIAGLISNSYSMKADAIHSLSDVLISIIVLVGIKIASKSGNEKMPYGYARIECIASIILSFILFDVGGIIGYNAITSLINGTYQKESIKTITLIINILSIVTKIFMFIVTSIVAKKTNYGALKADAWHQLSDALSSIAVFIGIIGTVVGIDSADKFASLFICLILLKVALDIFIDSSKKLIDHSADKESLIKINNILSDFSKVYNFSSYKVKTRIFSNYINTEIEIIFNDNYLITDTSQICNKIAEKIKLNILCVKYCIIFINYHS